MKPDREQAKQILEPNQAITLLIVKNRGGEEGRLAFGFSPPFASFAEGT